MPLITARDAIRPALRRFARAGRETPAVRPRSELSRKCWPFRGIVMIGTVAAAWVSTGCREKKPPPPSPTIVQVMRIEPKDVPIYKEWIGTLDGFVNAQIRAQVVGYLLSQNYTEGSEVKKGD